VSLRLVVLASGHGSNLRALLRAIDDGRCAAEVAAVVSDREDAGAFELARSRGIPERHVALSAYDSRAAWDSALASAIDAFTPSLVVLAGFMKIVGACVLERFGGRIVNVHPSLLPSFPGKDGPAQALAAGVRVSGCTVHLVDEGVDTGAILAQGVVPVLPDDDPARLHARIQTVEHLLLPAVVQWIATEAIELGPPLRVRDLPFPARLFTAPLIERDGA
jgi:phosphoribosylglycinamide formyltransferase 1